MSLNTKKTETEYILDYARFCNLYLNYSEDELTRIGETRESIQTKITDSERFISEGFWIQIH